MLTINVIGGNDKQVITGSIDGEKFSVNFTDDMYKNLLVLKENLTSIATMEEYDVWVTRVKTLLDTETEDIITTSCADLMKNINTGHYYVTANGKTSNKSVPQPLVDVILHSVDKGIDPSPIVKAWIRYLRNPFITPAKAENYARYITAQIIDWEKAEELQETEGLTRQIAILRSTYNDVAITQEGLIVGKKYARLLTKGWTIDKDNKAIKVKLYDREDDTIDSQTGVVTEGKIKDSVFNEDLVFEPPMMGTGGDAFLCGAQNGHIIKVGQKHTLENWKMVNTNDNISCVPGLHVGGLQYVQNYKGHNYQLLECFIDPSEIGAICDISRGDGAMRVREYFIYGATEGRNEGIYHSSHYAAMKDADWETYKAEAIEKSNKLMGGLKEEIDSLGL